MPTASITESGPRPSGQVAHRGGDVVGALDVERLDAVGGGAGEPLGDEVDADDEPGAAVLGDPARHLADRAEPEHDHAAAVRDVGVLDRLPRGRQHVGEVDEAVVGRAVRAP